MSDRDIMESRARYVEEKIAQAKSDEFKALTAERDELKKELAITKRALGIRLAYSRCDQSFTEDYTTLCDAPLKMVCGSDECINLHIKLEGEK